MDLNYLIHREGVERLRAVRAASREAREAHRGLADIFRNRIDSVRRDKLAAAGLRPELRPPAL